jgi:hypothetical protein
MSQQSKDIVRIVAIIAGGFAICPLSGWGIILGGYFLGGLTNGALVLPGALFGAALVVSAGALVGGLIGECCIDGWEEFRRARNR